MNEPFHSIASAAMFTLFGLAFGFAATAGDVVTIGVLEIGERTLWVVTGVSFIMSYFSLVHLRHH